MATTTTNYNLVKPDGIDLYNVEDFNGNAETIDGLIKDVNDALRDKTTALEQHIADHNNPHQVTKAQVGLSEVDNKSSEQIRREITFANVQSALYAPQSTNDTIDAGGTTFDKFRLLILHDTATNWNTVNPTLRVGEFGYDTTNKIVKIGDGVTAWNDLHPANYDNIYTALVAYVDQQINALVDGAPEALDTLREIAEFIDEFPDEFEALEELVESKADKTLATAQANGLMSSGHYVKVEALSSGIEKIINDDTFDTAVDPSATYTKDYTRALGKGNSITVDQGGSALGTEARQVSFHGTNIDIYFGSTHYANSETGIDIAQFPTVELCITKSNILTALEAPTTGSQKLLTNTGTWISPTEIAATDFIGRQFADEQHLIPVAGENGLIPAPPAVVDTQVVTNDGVWANFNDMVDAFPDVTTSKHGFMSAADKVKLNGIAEGANKYVHPSGNGYSHIPSGGTSDQILQWYSAGRAKWVDPDDVFSPYEYEPATEQEDGLMSHTDKAKLNGIEANANNYIHPTTSGYYHIPSGGSSGKILGWFANGQAQWIDMPASPVEADYTLGLSNHTLQLKESNTVVSTVSLPVYSISRSGTTVTLTDGITPSTFSLDTYTLTFDDDDGILYLNCSDGTDTQVTLPSFSPVTTTEDGLMIAADKVKLDGIASGANNYTHPTYTAANTGFYRFSVTNEGHVNATTPVVKADITALGIPGQDTTYNAFTGATSSVAGEAGLVPAPTVNDVDYFLKGDGTWANVTTTILTSPVPVEKGGTGVTTVADIKTLLGITNVDNTSDLNKPISTATQTALNLKADKSTTYTKSEVDGMISDLSSGLDWKESVDTYSDIATTYPSPQDGWTVNVKDTNYTYRYDGTSWVAISANAIPLASSLYNGLMSSADKVKLDSLVNVNSSYASAVGGTNQITFTTLAGNSDVVAFTPSIANNVTYTNESKETYYSGNDMYIPFALANSSTQDLTGVDCKGAKINRSSLTRYLREDGSWADLSTSFVTSVNGSTGAITVDKSTVGLSNVDDRKQISAYGNALVDGNLMMVKNVSLAGGVSYIAAEDSGISAQDVQDLIDAGGGGVSGVKGNAESTYRTGNVNLTAANIGAVAGLASGTTQDHLVAFGADGYTIKDSTIAISSLVTGVKGANESSYRGGNVSIDASNIGLGNVTNNKQLRAIDSSVANRLVAFSGTDGCTTKDSGLLISNVEHCDAKLTQSNVTASTTTVTLSSSSIYTTSYFKIYTSIYGYCPTTVAVSSGSITLTFPGTASEAFDIEVRVEN